MTENVLNSADVCFPAGDQETAEGMPQVVKSKSLTRIEFYSGFDCRGPQVISHYHVTDAILQNSIYELRNLSHLAHTDTTCLFLAYLTWT